MNKFIKITTIVLLTLFLSCQKRYTADEIVEYLPIKPTKEYKVIKDSVYGDYWQFICFVVDSEYYNRNKRMIEQHYNFRDLGHILDSLGSYSGVGYQPEAFLFDDKYFYYEDIEGSPRLKDKFLNLGIILEEDSIICISCRPL